MYSEKNKKLVVLDGFKFGYPKQLAGDIERWICVKRKCKSYLKINHLNSTVDKSIIHNHKKVSDKILNRQILSNSSKKKSSRCII
jgi:hypothetical protein